MASGRPVRILLAILGLDQHEAGAFAVARMLRDAGMEVIYSGLHQTAEMIAEAALQEDVDAVGLSLLSGAHLAQFPAVCELLRERGAGDIIVFGGGIIPEEDFPILQDHGVARLFTPGTSTDEIIAWVEANVRSDD